MTIYTYLLLAVPIVGIGFVLLGLHFYDKWDARRHPGE